MDESLHNGDAVTDPRASLPSVNRLLDHPMVQAMATAHGRPTVLEAIHVTLDALRSADQSQHVDADILYGLDAVVARVIHSLDDLERDRIRPVVNATGVVLHTGLGRAVLAPDAVKALAGLDRCCNLQIDLDSGKRGKRNFMCEWLLCHLTGAQAAMVVNNNAAATYLILSALCRNREVVVSRGQLIEIGGSYRLPDCIHESGATLVEVGTTNKTHLRDYEAAIKEQTAALMHVNPSNYRIVGFSKSVPTKDLVILGHKHGLLVIDDLGCGALVPLESRGLPHEPTVQDSIADGADLCCFSGDKLIGGPQSGIIVGRKDLITTIRKHPLTRMLRVDKLTDMALEYTLRLFLAPDTLWEKNPTLRMLAKPLTLLDQEAASLLNLIQRSCPAICARVLVGESAVGGGSLPDSPLPTCLIGIRCDKVTPAALARKLRFHEPPVIARIQDDELLLDVRTLLPGDDAVITHALASIFEYADSTTTFREKDIAH